MCKKCRLLAIVVIALDHLVTCAILDRAVVTELGTSAVLFKYLLLTIGSTNHVWQRAVFDTANQLQECFLLRYTAEFMLSYSVLLLVSGYINCKIGLVAI